MITACQHTTIQFQTSKKGFKYAYSGDKFWYKHSTQDFISGAEELAPEFASLQVS